MYILYAKMIDNMNKQEQRLICKNNLSKLTDIQKNEYSKIICDKVLALLNKNKILSYKPTKQEVNVTTINNLLNPYYPVTIDEHKMEAYKVTNDDFIINRFGIQEPNKNTSTLINPTDIEIIIVPLLGFDDKCNRLGHGLGYYDNYLIRCHKAIKIGVGFEAQKLDHIICNDNDIKLDLIVTEKNIYKLI